MAIGSTGAAAAVTAISSLISAALVQQTYLLGSSNVVRATDDYLKYLMVSKVARG